jgi:SRSO17 transposase
VVGVKARRFIPLLAVSLDALVPADRFSRHLDQALDLTVVHDVVPGPHFLHNARWDADALNRCRLEQWQAHPGLRTHVGGELLIVDETGDPKRGQGIVLAAQQYLGKLERVANGVMAVTSHGTDGSRHGPLGVKPYRPESRLPKGRKGPAFHTKPQLAWDLNAEARAAGIPFCVVVADSVYGESAA